MKLIKLIYIFIFSLLFSLIPWENLRNSTFRDREVYFEYANYGLNVLDYQNFDSFYSYVFNEWLWHFLIKNINNFISYELFFSLITFGILLCMTYFLVKKVSLVAPFLLFNPLVIDLAFSQYRICLAMIFLSLALLSKNKKIFSVLFLFLAIITHTSSLIFIFIYLFIYLSDKFVLNKKIYIFLLVFLGLMLSLLLSDYLSDILSYFNDRRGYSDPERVSSSPIYLSFWIFNFLTIFYCGIKYGLRSFSQKYSLVILSLIVGNIVFGGYSTRFLAVSFPILIKANYENNSYIKIITIGFYSLYLMLQWFYWLK